MPALSIKKYVIRRSNPSGVAPTANITTFSMEPGTHFSTPFIRTGSKKRVFTVENQYMSMNFSAKWGKPVSVLLKASGKRLPFEINMLKYNSAGSGAYIFRPMGDAVPYSQDKHPVVRLVEGALLSQVWVRYRDKRLITVATMYHVNGPLATAIDLNTELDMKDSFDEEVIVRVSSSAIKSGDHFYTDTNGFQMVRRRTNLDNSRPISSNYYPVTSVAYLAGDAGLRLSVHVDQAHGAASLRSGELEVMLDRRLSSDDNKGLAENVEDIPVTKQTVRVSLEMVSGQSDERDHFQTDTANALNYDLNNRPTLFMMKQDVGNNAGADFPDILRLTRDNLPCEVHLMNVRHLFPSDYRDTLDNITHQFAIIFHRQVLLPTSCQLSNTVLPKCSSQNLPTAFSLNSLLSKEDIKLVHDLRETSLTLLNHTDHKLATTTNLLTQLKPMELHVFRLQLNAP